MSTASQRSSTADPQREFTLGFNANNHTMGTVFSVDNDLCTCIYTGDNVLSRSGNRVALFIDAIIGDCGLRPRADDGCSTGSRRATARSDKKVTIYDSEKNDPFLAKPKALNNATARFDRSANSRLGSLGFRSRAAFPSPLG